MIKELEKELEKFTYKEKAELTDRELAVLRGSINTKETYDTFFKYLLGVESDKGISLAYDIESLPTAEEGVAPEVIAENARFHKMLTRFVRSKLEHLSFLIKTDIETDIKVLTDVEKEKAEIQKQVNDKKSEIVSLQKELDNLKDAEQKLKEKTLQMEVGELV